MTSYFWELPSATPENPDDVAPVADGSINHVTGATDRLLEQFKNKTNLVSLVEILAAPTQDVEDALQQLLSNRSVDTATGDNLDIIGDLVGQPRAGETDTDYRRLIRARISVSRSRGLVSDVLKVARAIVNDATADVILDLQGMAALVLRIESIALSGTTTATQLLAFLQDTVAAGVRVIVETWPSADESDVFGFALLTSVTHSAPAASVSFRAVTAGFPSTGTLILAQGTADEETVTYNGKTATSFTGVTPLTNIQGVGNSVTLSDGTAGFGDDSDPLIGAELASALD